VGQALPGWPGRSLAGCQAGRLAGWTVGCLPAWLASRLHGFSVAGWLLRGGPAPWPGQCEGPGCGELRGRLLGWRRGRLPWGAVKEGRELCWEASEPRGGRQGPSCLPYPSFPSSVPFLPFFPSVAGAASHAAMWEGYWGALRGRDGKKGTPYSVTGHNFASTTTGRPGGQRGPFGCGEKKGPPRPPNFNVGKVKKWLCHRCNHLVHLTHPRKGPTALNIEIGGAGGGVPL
jgi:hypothetical protein